MKKILLVLFMSLMTQTALAKGVTTSSTSVQPERLSTYDAWDLSRAYSKNAVEANKEFKNKRFIIIGIISTINTDNANTPYIVMALPHFKMTPRGSSKSPSFFGVRAKFAPGQQKKIANLALGQKIKLDCIGAGEVDKVPFVRKCVIL